MEINSFTSEPQYQRPDERNDVVHYIPRGEPQPAPMDPGMGAAGNMMYLDPNMARPLFNKFGAGAWVFNRLDFYGNSIILGAICNALAFIIYGFYRCKVYRVNDTFLWSVILLFGGLGQITAGVMELIKKREFPSFLYLIYGIYCLTHYSLRVMIDRFGEYDLCIFFMAFFLLSIPTILYSINTNIIFLLETCFTSLYFFFISIGEAVNEYILIEQVAGACLTVSGLLSFYIFFSQNINSINLYRYVRTFPFNSHNKSYNM